MAATAYVRTMFFDLTVTKLQLVSSVIMSQRESSDKVANFTNEG
jgi:hypothetical protein